MTVVVRCTPTVAHSNSNIFSLALYEADQKAHEEAVGNGGVSIPKWTCFRPLMSHSL